LKIWKDDDPKASLMSRKRALIVDAARQSFLTGGYAQTSMDSIAKGAGVSIKTVYRHFENKDDLFSAVMQAACSAEPIDVSSTDHSWFERPPRTGLLLGGAIYLRHALSADQLALYRVVIRDAGRFPELGRRYTEEVVKARNALMVAYLDRWSGSQGWKVKDSLGAANTFVGLLRSGWFEEVLLGAQEMDEVALQRHVKGAAKQMLILLESKGI
jgi:AcrR family transcriptional regulator